MTVISRANEAKGGKTPAAHFCSRLLPPRGREIRMSCSLRAMKLDPLRRSACLTMNHGNVELSALSLAKVMPDVSDPTSVS